MIVGPFDTGTRGYCDVCTALDRLETRRVVRTRFDLCQACVRVLDEAHRYPEVDDAA